MDVCMELVVKVEYCSRLHHERCTGIPVLPLSSVESLLHYSMTY